MSDNQIHRHIRLVEQASVREDITPADAMEFMDEHKWRFAAAFAILAIKGVMTYRGWRRHLRSGADTPFLNFLSMKAKDRAMTEFDAKIKKLVAEYLEGKGKTRVNAYDFLMGLLGTLDTAAFNTAMAVTENPDERTRIHRHLRKFILVVVQQIVDEHNRTNETKLPSAEEAKPWSNVR